MTEPLVAINREYRHSVLIRLHLARVHNRIEHEEAETLAAHGLTVPQFDLLSRLMTEPGISQQELANRLLVTKGNVGGMIDRLEAAGLVERCGHPEDRRAYRLYATEAGERVFRAAAPDLEAAVDRRMDVLTPEEQAALLALLAKLDRSLKE